MYGKSSIKQKTETLRNWLLRNLKPFYNIVILLKYSININNAYGVAPVSRKRRKFYGAKGIQWRFQNLC